MHLPWILTIIVLSSQTLSAPVAPKKEAVKSFGLSSSFALPRVAHTKNKKHSFDAHILSQRSISEKYIASELEETSKKAVLNRRASPPPKRVPFTPPSIDVTDSYPESADFLIGNDAQMISLAFDLYSARTVIPQKSSASPNGYDASGSISQFAGDQPRKFEILGNDNLVHITKSQYSLQIAKFVPTHLPTIIPSLFFISTFALITYAALPLQQVPAIGTFGLAAPRATSTDPMFNGGRFSTARTPNMAYLAAASTLTFSIFYILKTDARNNQNNMEGFRTQLLYGGVNPNFYDTTLGINYYPLAPRTSSDDPVRWNMVGRGMIVNKVYTSNTIGVVVLDTLAPKILLKMRLVDEIYYNIPGSVFMLYEPQRDLSVWLFPCNHLSPPPSITFGFEGKLPTVIDYYKMNGEDFYAGESGLVGLCVGAIQYKLTASPYSTFGVPFFKSFLTVYVHDEAHVATAVGLGIAKRQK